MLNQAQQFTERIRKAERVLIAFNKHWSGDAVGSALALAAFLEKNGKQVEVAAENNGNGTAFRFLPGFAGIRQGLPGGRDLVISLALDQARVGLVRHQLKEDRLDLIVSPSQGQFKPENVQSRLGQSPYDLIITVDSRDLESLGSIYDGNPELFYQVPLINIDNHPGNEEFGQINLVELTAVATAEIVFDLLAAAGREALDEDIATCLLAGIIAKTRSFKTPNITPAALNAVAQLIAMGGRRDEIVNRLYRSRALPVLKLWGVVLARLKSALDHQLVWSLVTTEDFRKTGTTPTDLAEVVEELITNIPQARAIALLYEEPEAADKSAIQLYAIKNLDALALLKEASPDGSKAMALARVEQTLKQLEEEMIALLTDKIGRLNA